MGNQVLCRFWKGASQALSTEFSILCCSFFIALSCLKFSKKGFIVNANACCYQGYKLFVFCPSRCAHNFRLSSFPTTHGCCCPFIPSIPFRSGLEILFNYFKKKLLAHCVLLLLNTPH